MRRMDQPGPPPTFAPPLPTPPSNTNSLGLAGFITALVGIALTGGLLCPVGLILSLIALSRRPRGFAIAGTVIGLLGSCGSCLVALFLLPVLAGGAAALALVAAGGLPAIHTLDHMWQVKLAIERYEKTHQVAPESLSELSLPSDMLDDGWGTPLQYERSTTDGRSCWTLRSAGPDRQIDASDVTMTGCTEAPRP
jgi:hypothetical protein